MTYSEYKLSRFLCAMELGEKNINKELVKTVYYTYVQNIKRQLEVETSLKELSLEFQKALYGPLLGCLKR